MSGSKGVTALQVPGLTPPPPSFGFSDGFRLAHPDGLTLPLTLTLGCSDGFRQAHPDASGQFTFWSQRAQGRPRNRGLRLDYFLLCEVSPSVGSMLQRAQV